MALFRERLYIVAAAVLLAGIAGIVLVHLTTGIKPDAMEESKALWAGSIF